MSKKSVRGAGPGLDQAPDPAAPGGGRTPDSGGTPVEPWGGERTDRVSGRETSGPRVALVPAVSGEGRVVDPSSTADTSRMADSGRTTLMGVPSPIVNQSDKPTTSPGHGVHLPADSPRPADARPAVGSGEQEASGKATASASQDHSGKSPGAAAQEHKQEEDKSLGGGGKEPREGNAGGVVPNERTIAAAAATFRAGAADAGKQPGPEGEREPERSWTADRTQEFRLEPPAAAPSAFAKTLVTGMAIAAGTGILVAGFIHSRLHGGAAEQSELARSPGPPAMAPVPLPPPPLPDNPVPPAAGEPTNVPTVPANAGASEAPNAANAPAMVAPQPEAPAAEAAPARAAVPEANRAAVPEANQGADAASDAGKVERRLAARPRTPAAPGRIAPLPRTPRVLPSTARPGVTPFPGAPPSPSAQAPAATSPPTTPPPLTTPPPIDRPVAKPDLPRTEGKPYDPDMPLPPTME